MINLKVYNIQLTSYLIQCIFYYRGNFVFKTRNLQMSYGIKLVVYIATSNVFQVHYQSCILSVYLPSYSKSM